MKNCRNFTNLSDTSKKILKALRYIVKNRYESSPEESQPASPLPPRREPASTPSPGGSPAIAGKSVSVRSRLSTSKHSAPPPPATALREPAPRPLPVSPPPNRAPGPVRSSPHRSPRPHSSRTRPPKPAKVVARPRGRRH